VSPIKQQRKRHPRSEPATRLLWGEVMGSSGCRVGPKYGSMDTAISRTKCRSCNRESGKLQRLNNTHCYRAPSLGKDGERTA
jgi:hypothetical protein